MRTIEEVNKDITEARSDDADYATVILPLVEERNAILKHDRDSWDDVHYSISIDCPAHLTHKATLYTHGHRYAGVWECDKDGDHISDVCPHFDVDVETVEDTEGNESRIYVCVLCGVAVQGDPDSDKDFSE
jgi:hypothetical protein